MEQEDPYLGPPSGEESDYLPWEDWEEAPGDAAGIISRYLRGNISGDDRQLLARHCIELAGNLLASAHPRAKARMSWHRVLWGWIEELASKITREQWLKYGLDAFDAPEEEGQARGDRIFSFLLHRIDSAADVIAAEVDLARAKRELDHAERKRAQIEAGPVDF
jgi:hypothetical protein